MHRLLRVSGVGNNIDFHDSLIQRQIGKEMKKPKTFKITLRPLENSTISSACMFLRPYTRAIPSPIDNTRPVSSNSAFGADPKILCSNIEETSAVPVTQN